MQKILWISFFGACALSMNATADVLVMPAAEAASAVDTSPAPYASAPEAAVIPAEEALPETASAPAEEPAPAAAPVPVAAPAPVAAPVAMPDKGQNMATVLKQFGEPKLRHKPAGGDSPRHPAITRWDYESFSVFFERGKVIDSVNHSKPAAIHHSNELKPLEY